jgi:putative transposase
VGTLPDELATGAVVADQSYDADWLVVRITGSRAEAVIPLKVNQIEQRVYDTNPHAERKKVERLFNRLKRYRRVATRYEELEMNYLAMVYVASIMTLLF